ncbi:PLP-dependent aminotransferase family protein [Sphingomonas sp. DG1-23]|uniref:MocR-like pyridoxine biosynthesis transcription factor PdxR n=1 Tax=Sphingomonas sp. DG1-23 TaxID=3068316 RepID=UPI00273F08D6|nr:PLP-dependent aminotransferase family protein [Sphingomonas sp. DG1-23]MDP5277935.1 PLP-dependent aminotransferase family protein [Sphingomonas sp. DG1-23]
MTSSLCDLPLAIDRNSSETLGAQLRRGLLDAIRRGVLRPGVSLPSTRALAAQLRISRPLIVEAYGQLAAEGYLKLRQGARPVVAPGVTSVERRVEEAGQVEAVRFDLRPAMPDVGMFPRRDWLRAIRAVLGTLPAAELGYGDLRGSPVLRAALADYLGRVRGVVADPASIFVTSGFAEGRALVCAAFHARGIRRVAVEDPGYSDWVAVDKAGLRRVPVQVDENGVDVDRLVSLGADAAFVTPAHQFPVGGVLSAARRQKLIGWLQEADALALEDDYDAEFRYDQSPVGALQGLARDNVVYAGTASKTLAPALRLGWLVVPPALVPTMTAELRRWSEGPPRIDQDALAELLRSGAYDRQLRKMRRHYRERRNQLLAALSRLVPDLSIEGAAAGLHVTLRLPDAIDAAGEAGIVDYLRTRGIATEGTGRYSASHGGPRRLFIGYGRIAESGIEPSIAVLAQAVEGALNAAGRGAA